MQLAWVQFPAPYVISPPCPQPTRSDPWAQCQEWASLGVATSQKVQRRNVLVSEPEGCRVRRPKLNRVLAHTVLASPSDPGPLSFPLNPSDHRSLPETPAGVEHVGRTHRKSTEEEPEAASRRRLGISQDT